MRVVELTKVAVRKLVVDVDIKDRILKNIVLYILINIIVILEILSPNHKM